MMGTSVITHSRVVVYLQSQDSVDTLPQSYSDLTAINLSSFHFGYNPDGSPYIHLNNDDPDDAHFDALWLAMRQAQEAGVKVIAMLGGAGKAYGVLFRDYETFYQMWADFLRRRGLDGVDLDVEEPVSLQDMQKLIADLRRDFSENFYLTAAPVAGELKQDSSARVDWKSLAPSIDWFNVQFYSGSGTLASTDDYDKIIARGYSPAQIVAGALTNPSNGAGYVPIADVCQTLSTLAAHYAQFGGTMGWEHYNANNRGETADPVEWCAAMKAAVQGRATGDGGVG
jgi:Glycosyl hydrolases family 18